MTPDARDLRRAAARLVDAAVARRDIDRRAFLGRGSALAAALAGAALSACDSRGPDGARRLLALAERKNETVERWLTRHTAMNHARGANAGDRFPAYHVAKLVPTWDEPTMGHWALEVSGLVRTPLRLSLEQLVALPQRQQKVNHYCVEGWNAIATFWGVRVADLARLAGALPQAQYVDFVSFEHDDTANVDYHESWDLESATHPQTLVVYAKDGAFLNAAYGAPARVHSPVKLGYKNTKYLTKVVFGAARNGGYWSDQGYEWYGGT